MDNLSQYVSQIPSSCCPRYLVGARPRWQFWDINTRIAGSFYGFSTILIPYGLPQDKLNALLSRTSADHVIAEAGTLDLEAMQSANKTLKNIIWVTKTGSQHMEWSEDAPKGFTVNSWQGLVKQNQRSTNSEVLPLDKDSKVPPISIFCPAPNGTYDLVKYTSEVSLPPAGRSTRLP